MKARRAYAEKNHLGFWVGWIADPDGARYPISNAFHDEGRALEVAQRVAAAANTADLTGRALR